MIVLLFGPPGSGKGTQAKLLEKDGFIHLSTGDLFRKEIETKTELGEKIQLIVSSGKLVSDKIVNELVKKYLDQYKEKDVVLDGYPRTMEQAEFLVNGWSIHKVIVLQVPDQEIIERLSLRRVCPNCGASYHLKIKPPKKANVCDLCGSELIQRPDDKPDVIRKRLAEYHEITEELLSLFRKLNIPVCMVDGTQSIDMVHKDIVNKLWREC